MNNVQKSSAFFQTFYAETESTKKMLRSVIALVTWMDNIRTEAEEEDTIYVFVICYYWYRKKLKVIYLSYTL